MIVDAGPGNRSVRVIDALVAAHIRGRALIAFSIPFDHRRARPRACACRIDSVKRMVAQMIRTAQAHWDGASF
jgi:hypothetical protein